MRHNYAVDVLHAFPLFPGDSVDGCALTERSFVSVGRHEIIAEADRVQSLEADGYIEILSADGHLNVWPACCNGNHS